MKLTEYYALGEGHDKFYTLEPEGRLLEWDQTVLSEDEMIEEEMSYEVIGTGDTGNLITELQKRISLSSKDLDQIEYNLSMGCKVTVLREGNEVKVRL